MHVADLKQMAHCRRVPINFLLKDVEPREKRTESQPPAVLQASEAGTVRRPHFDSAVPAFRAGPSPIPVPPQTEGSPPPALEGIVTGYKEVTVHTADEESDAVPPRNDPLWGVAAVPHVAGHVKTPVASAAFEWYEEDLFRDKKRERAREEMSDDPRLFGRPRLD
jgi:hypothetical protein